MGTYKLVVYRFVDLTDYKTTKQHEPLSRQRRITLFRNKLFPPPKSVKI